MTEGAKPKITVVIPAFNEEDTVGHVVRKILAHADTVVVIDDGSSDKTPEAARGAGAIVLHHKGNMGYGRSLATGFEYVRNNGTEIMVVIDGDGQHNPDYIPRFIEPILSGESDLVIGTRFYSGRAKSDIPLYRKIGIYAINRLWQMKSSYHLTDTQCGFRAYSRKAVERIQIREDGMSASLDILSQALRSNLRITEVPVRVTYHGQKSAMDPIRHGLELLKYILSRDT